MVYLLNAVGENNICDEYLKTEFKNSKRFLRYLGNQKLRFLPQNAII